MLLRQKGKRGKGLGWKPGRGSAPRMLSAAPPPPAPPELTRRSWYAGGWWGDQGNTSQCVIYSWLHLIHDGPVIPKDVAPKMAKPLADPTTLYQEGQKIDGANLLDVDTGLTCDAGAKVMRLHGWIGEYRWAEKVDEIVNWILTTGPCALGATWYNDMFEPKYDGSISMTGGVAGGHQWVIDGVNTVEEKFRDKNSWNRTWGRSGFFSHTFAQMQQMLDEGAEVCMYRELPIKY